MGGKKETIAENGDVGYHSIQLHPAACRITLKTKREEKCIDSLLSSLNVAEFLQSMGFSTC